MSQEREDPAKWQMHQDYKRLSERYAALLNQIREWAGTMSRTGNTLSAHPEAVAQVDMGTMDSGEFERVRQEIIGLQSKLHSLKDTLTKMGVNDL